MYLWWWYYYGKELCWRQKLDCEQKLLTLFEMAEDDVAAVKSLHLFPSNSIVCLTQGAQPDPLMIAVSAVSRRARPSFAKICAVDP